MYVILLLLCGVEAIYDRKTKTIHTLIWIITAIGGMVWNITQNEKDILWIASSTVVGLFLILCSKLFKGSIGIGDGIVFLTLGMGLGMESASQILFSSSMLCLIWGVGQVLWKKCSKKKELPFLPFVFLGIILNGFGGI